MKQAVHGGAGEEGIVEERVPLGQVAVRGHDGGHTLVALPDDLVEVDRLVVYERPQPEVVDDEEVDAREAEHLANEGAIAAGGTQLGEEIVRAGDVRLADAGRADEQQVLAPIDEGAGGGAPEGEGGTDAPLPTFTWIVPGGSLVSAPVTLEWTAADQELR